jgi:hypothetical protein
MAAMQAGRGTSWCVQSAVLLLRNPAAQGATVTLDGSRYRAKTALVPAGGSAQLRMASRATCGAAKPEPTASVRYDDGTTATVTLPMDGFGG